MIDTDLVEGALELISHAFGRGAVTSTQPTTEDMQALELSPRERELVGAIQARRNVSIEAAEDLVRWLRTQTPRLTL